MTAAPKLSVCIPAYNRSEVLADLLETIVSQDYADYEVVIVEDHSPERDEIRAIVQRHADRYPQIHYFENKKNLGYDGNMREVILRASGDYCFFMGNDDLMAVGALRAV